MLNPNINSKKLCEDLGLLDMMTEALTVSECISSLADDLYIYSHYDDIEMDCKDRADGFSIPSQFDTIEMDYEARDEAMAHSKDYYGTRILKALDQIFYNKSKADIHSTVKVIAPK